MILDALKKHQVPAAFFVVGNYLETSPDLVKRMVSEGHIVANHTYHHPDMSKMEEQFGIKNDVTVSGLARMPEVLTMDQVPEDEDRIWHQLSGAVEEAAKKFVDSRVQEGEKLKEDLLGKLAYMSSLVAFIERNVPRSS